MLQPWTAARSRDISLHTYQEKALAQLLEPQDPALQVQSLVNEARDL